MLVGESVFTKFGIHILQTNLVEFIYSHGNVDNLVGCSYDFGNTRQDFSVVDLDLYSHSEAREDRVDNLHQLNFIQQRVASHHIAIELVELAVTTFLGTIGAPNSLILIAFEGELNLIAMHHDEARERHSQVVAQTLFTKLGSQMQRITLAQFLICRFRQEIAGVQYFKQKLVAFLAVLAHQGLQGLHGRSFDLLKAIEGIDVTNGVEDIVTLRHLNRRKVTRTFGNTWFICHFSILFVLYRGQ